MSLVSFQKPIMARQNGNRSAAGTEPHTPVSILILFHSGGAGGVAHDPPPPTAL